MESKRMFLVVCMIGCAVSCIKADGHLSTNLTSKITRTECGKTKLCLDIPKGCDPSGSSQCFFTSVNLTNINIKVELSGSSTGYIALAAGMTSNVLQDHNIIFVCGNDGNFFFRTPKLFNNTLEITNIPNVTNIQGSIQSNLIQCVFSIPIDEKITSFLNVSGSNLNISNIANSYIPVFLDILNGSTNGAELGTPTSVLESSVLVNLTNVNSTNAVSTPASTPASTTTRTTTMTTAHSYASISLTSLSSHGAELGTPTSVLQSSALVNVTDVNSTNVVSTPASTPASNTTRTTTMTTAHSNTSMSLTSLSSHGTELGTPTSVLTSSVMVSITNVNSTNVVSTPASTPASTTTKTPAHSNSSISLTSLLSHAAICFLSIFLHLI